MRQVGDVLGTFAVGKDRVTAIVQAYRNRRLAVELIAEDGEPYTVLSVNLVDAPAPPEDCFYVKTWSEHNIMRGPALASGLFENTGKRSPNFLQAEVWKIK
jgi:hypothetical protein